MPHSGRLITAACLLTLASGTAAAQTAAPDAAGDRNLRTLEPVGAATPGLWITSYGRGAPRFNADSVQMLPWARGLFATRQSHDLEPHARCKASGAVRQFLTPYGVEFVEIPELKRLYIFDIGGPHTYREVFMDGRGHPAKMQPSNYGHNIGWWDGDTLVVDSVGYNEDFWFERAGLPHTEAAHVVERYRRTDANTIEYTFTLQDSLTYATPVEGSLSMSWREGDELFEYICQQGNYAFDLMVVPEDLTAIGRTSAIVP
jgi:hypothetical protein